MSNETISVPRADLEQALGGEMKDVLAAQRKLRALLARPAEQPKPCATIRLERIDGKTCATVARWDADQLQEGALMNVYLNQPAEQHQGDGVNWKAVANEQMGIIQKLKAEQHQGEPALYVEQWELDRIANGGAAWATAWTTDGKENPSRPGDCVALYTRPGAKPDGFEIARHSKRLVEQLRARIAELEQQPAPAAVVREGWQLVPTVPTDDMIVAFAEAWYSKRQTIDDPDMLDAYRDMLVVAPSPPQQ
ncbi:hypothetical protein H7A76_31885 [Pseudomonas sp. MSSRFD41]|uniref:hypothetical protein n=1 Tax=Pseudomonas sp. MSSRFD41 TaxID=1310370 RepID=UPI00163ADA69|nr:hypothetical protein [Pseudomonas sp. MSSRFD41]MBC2660053.1 hypothetical protein [Pseudomonas sp. MSSRFD41]